MGMRDIERVNLKVSRPVRLAINALAAQHGMARDRNRYLAQVLKQDEHYARLAPAIKVRLEEEQ